LYSLGCTMFFMLAGRPPFGDGTMVQKLLQHQQTAPPAIEELRPDVPRRFGAILMRLMAKDPADRYQRPADLAADLAACAAEEGVAVVAPRAAPVVVVPAHRPLAPRLPWLVPLMGLVAVVAALWWRTAAERRPVEPPPAAAPESNAKPAGNAL
jgi:serine/threonine-protein kinase